MSGKNCTVRHLVQNFVGNRNRWALAAGLVWLCAGGLSGSAVAQTSSDHATQPLLFRLDPITRWKILGLLGLIVVLGMVAIVLIRLTGKVVRRYVQGPARPSPWTTPPAAADDWAATPIVPQNTRWLPGGGASDHPEDSNGPDRGSIAT